MSLSFLIKPFSNLVKNLSILRTKRALQVTQKAFPIIFKGTCCWKLTQIGSASLKLPSIFLLETTFSFSTSVRYLSYLKTDLLIKTYLKTIFKDNFHLGVRLTPLLGKF